SVQHLSVSYHGKEAIRDITFSVKNGKLVGIIGPNGAGKSTLMKAILGLIPKDTGSITFNGRKLKNVQKKIAYVPQRNMIDWDFPITVRDVVVMGTYPRLGIFHHPRRSEKQL